MNGATWSYVYDQICATIGEYEKLISREYFDENGKVVASYDEAVSVCLTYIAEVDGKNYRVEAELCGGKESGLVPQVASFAEV